MSRLNDLLRQLRMDNPGLANDLQSEFDALADRRSFGLNFERHVPEAVELPGRKVRKGDKVRVLPPRGEQRTAEHDQLWRVVSITSGSEGRTASLVSLDDAEEDASVAVDDLVVMAEFRDPIYPGLVSTGSVERGGDKPFHTVINAENFHALQTLLFTHRGEVDCIYIDPPYNTGAKDWKYNNDYVEDDDHYRHSKWLAFMERRLLLAKELLNPDESVLIVTIDEREVHRLGLLLEQVFSGCDIQTVTTVTNPAGSLRTGRFTRVEEYVFFVFVGDAVVSKWTTRMLDGEAEAADEPRMPTVWFTAIRQGGGGALRQNRTTPVLFYPLHLNREDGSFHSVGEPLPMDESVDDYEPPSGTIAVWPLHTDGTEQTWRFSGEQMRERFEAGTVRLGRRDPDTGLRSVTYLRPGTLGKIAAGEFVVTGRTDEGTVELELGPGHRGGTVPPAAVWRMRSHFARDYGTGILKTLVPGTEFPFPKSLHAVEDTLRVAVGANPRAVVLDFFSGSGTTAHAVARLNKQDGGTRRCVLVTNNEVAASEHRDLQRVGLRPGDPEWEERGIFESVTKPRVSAAFTGTRPDGKPVKGDYKFTDEFPMADGFKENVEFFTLTYEAPLRVASHREFSRIAPLLWLRAGSEGRRIEDISNGWDVADVYGVIADLDRTEDFLKAVAANDRLRTAFIVTDEDRLFESIVGELPDHVEPVRLYEAYLRNFELEAGRGAR